MKKIISFMLVVILIIIMVFSFSACGMRQKAEKYCSNCSESISNDAIFCEHCGTAINDTEKENENSESVNENHTPVDMGSFDSLNKLEEAVKRNPNDFKLPVVVSVYGKIIRDENDNIYLINANGLTVHQRAIINRAKIDYITEQAITEYFTEYRVYMKDDTKNRVITDDNVVITGIYQHSTRTFTDCAYDLRE